MDDEVRIAQLADFGAVEFSGADVVTFLQGQLSNDVTRVDVRRSCLAGYHNPQGRTIALLRLIALPSGELLALLPRELVAPVASRLGKYVLRSRVRIADASERWRLEGVIGDGARSDAFPENVDEQRVDANRIVVRVPGRVPRWLVVSGSDESACASPDVDPDRARALREAWRREDIAAGLPQVYAATSEAFVAQMLNLDLLGAIAFSKGCYTGQEVIARAHYRGRVKRRMQRFVSRGPLKLAPGDTGRLSDGRSFRVVDAVVLEDGRCEFLAVTNVQPGAAAAAEAQDDAADASAAPSIEADPLELPYSLPV
ncbi:MAG: hypothetical protein DIU56_001290 [Pseudomonadota bacterium]|jgi:folate-binding protein YgfZ